jgi:uncharacterized membrane protein AbrB (regulator of aidB expression)
MIGAIVLGVNGAKIQVPRIPFLGAQALIATMVAESITRSILPMRAWWPGQASPRDRAGRQGRDSHR